MISYDADVAGQKQMLMRIVLGVSKSKFASRNLSWQQMVL